MLLWMPVLASSALADATPVTRQHNMVVEGHPQTTVAGVAKLQVGDNVFDADIAFPSCCSAGWPSAA